MYIIESMASSILRMLKAKNVEVQVNPSHSKHCTGCKMDLSTLIKKPVLSTVFLTTLDLCRQIYNQPLCSTTFIDSDDQWTGHIRPEWNFLNTSDL